MLSRKPVLLEFAHQRRSTVSDRLSIPPGEIASSEAISAQTVCAIGGLDGNTQALVHIAAMAEAEPGPVTSIFNGDFNWFNRDPEKFAAVNKFVLQHAAIRGNVETEFAREQSTSGCGCGYPARVKDQTVAWSNQIIDVLRTTADQFERLQVTLRVLPQFFRVQVGDTAVAVVHGDCRSFGRVVSGAGKPASQCTHRIAE